MAARAQNLRKLGPLARQAITGGVLDNFREADVCGVQNPARDTERGAAAMAKLWGRASPTSATGGPGRTPKPNAKARFHESCKPS